MVCVLIVGAALLSADPQAAGHAPPAPDAGTTDPAALAEYNARRATTPDTADAHWKLGLWCEQKGLKPEATAEFVAVTRLDPRRESAWTKLGYEKRDGRWMTAEQAAADRAEVEAQRKADARWRPLLVKWKGWLGQESRRAEAEAALTAVDDPRAVPSIYRVFALGGADDQERAIDMLGHIEGEPPTRALAGLAIHGKTEVVRRAAIATLVRRPHDDSLMAWIGLLHDPIKYEVRQVAGPGSQGVLFVEGERFNYRRWYAPPSVGQTQDLFVDPPMGHQLMPLQLNSSPPGPPPGSRCVGRINNTDLYVFDYHWAMPKPVKSIPDPTPAYQQFERSQLQAQVDRDFEFAEAMKMAAGAQSQLAHDVGVIEASNAAIRETNLRLAEALRRVSGKDYGTDREEWLKWWMGRRGYRYIPPEERPRGTVDLQVPLPYVPQGGPPNLTSGGGGGGHRDGWCLVWDKEKGKQPKTGKCFSAGTLVHTPDGPRAIEELRAGDRISAGNAPDRGASPRTILAVHRGSAARTLRLELGGEALVTTEGHPFWKAGAGWTRAGDLEPGDAILSRNGPVRVEAVAMGEGRAVWNLEIAEGSEFFVGRLGLLVHDLSPIMGSVNVASQCRAAGGGSSRVMASRR